MRRVSVTVSTASKSGSLSSWLSFVVGQGWDFTEGEEGDQVVVDAAGLAPGASSGTSVLSSGA